MELILTLTVFATFHLCRGNNPKYVDRFLFTGITPLIYDDGNLNSDTHVSKNCQKSIIDIQDHLLVGSAWAYNFLDASSKASSGLLSGTVFSLGDYDQCLDARSERVDPPFQGKHCMVELRPPLHSNMTRLHPVLGWFNPTFALCVPSTCKPEDLTQLLLKKIKGWTIVDNVFCDTLHSISLFEKMKNLNVAQIVSLGLIIFLLLIETAATIAHFLHNGIHDEINMFCPIENIKSLFHPKLPSNRTTYVDGFKIFMIVFGVGAHTMICLEKFIAIGLVRNLEAAHNFFSGFFMQPMNEMGFDFFSVLSGFAITSTFYKLIRKGKIDYHRLILSRYFRFVPPTLILIALQLLWPLISNGPLYTRFSQIVVEDCSANWWKHVVFLANQDPKRACLVHTFFTSVDFQLFFLGLGILSLSVLLPTLTFLLCTFLFIWCYITLFQTTQGIGTPVLFGNHINLDESLNYMLKVHFPTFTHIPGSLAGMLTGYVLHHKKQLYEKSARNSAVHFLFLGPLLGVMFWSPALHSMLGLIPKYFYPYFIVTAKLSFVILAPNVILFVAHLPMNAKKDEKSVDTNLNTDLNNNQVNELSVGYRIFLIINEISFSMHLTNYLFVQYNFLTSRVLMDNSISAFIQRVIYSLYMIIILAGLFHILIVAPVERIRKHCFQSKEKVA